MNMAAFLLACALLVVAARLAVGARTARRARRAAVEAREWAAWRRFRARMERDDLVDVAQAAELVGRSVATITRWVARDTLAYAQGTRMFRASEVSRAQFSSLRR
jgi:hypothetical protein